MLQLDLTWQRLCAHITGKMFFLFFFVNVRQKVHLRTTLFRVVRNGRPRQRVIGRKRGELRTGKTQE